MSALAARRAAAAARASAQPSSVVPASTESELQDAANDAPAPSSSSRVNGHTNSSTPNGSTKKRKRPHRSTSPVATVTHLDTARNVPGTPAVARSGQDNAKGKAKARVRAFSPSAPIISLASEDSSNDGESVGSEMDEVEDVEASEVEADWSQLQTPRMPSPVAGPSTQPMEVRTAISSFRVQEGVNFARISLEDLPQPPGATVRNGEGLLISLSAEESLVIAGIYDITPILGSVEIMAATLKPSSATQKLRSQTVFAPTSHPLPVITLSSPSTTISPEQVTMLKRFALPTSFLLPSLDVSRAVFLITESHTGLEGLRKERVPGFSNIWGQELGSWRLKNIHPILESSLRPLYPHVAPQSWTQAIDTLRPTSKGHVDPEDDFEDAIAPVIFVRGAKGSGKSTFARTTLNSLLERYGKVAWLECDLGQSEFSPGGVTCLWVIDEPLLGPPFTHPRTPAKAHFLGNYTPLTCPDEYIASIRNLLEYYRYELPQTISTDKEDAALNIPLVINTQGWVKGLGEELLEAIEMAAEPTHIFTFDSPTVPIHSHEQGDGWTHSPTISYNPLHQTSQGRDPPIIRALESAPVTPLQSRHTSADYRTLSMMCYLHAHLASSNKVTWDFDRPLVGIQPLEVDLSPAGPLKQAYIIGEGSEGIVEEDLPLALNGAIVALLRGDVTSSDSIYSEGARPDMAESSSAGMALIRGIRPTDGGYKLQLVTPLSGEVLGGINMIVKNGAMELPLSGLLESQTISDSGVANMEEIPFVDVGGNEGVGIEKRRFRRNLMRKGM